MRVPPFGAVVLALLVADSAHAQSSPSDDAASAELASGYALRKEGKCAEAMPYLLRSRQLSPSPRTFLNLADCEEQLKKLASAWHYWQLAREGAERDGEKGVVDEAQRRLRALDARLPKVTLGLDASVPSGATVEWDGAPLAGGALGNALPSDPGRHVALVHAPGRQDGRIEVTLQEGEARLVTLSSGPVTESFLASQGATPATETPAQARDGSTRRVLAIVAGAVGVVAVGSGIFVGLSAKSSYDDATANDCGKAVGAASSNTCTATGKSARDGAGTKADVATAAFIVGGAAIAGGAALWFTAPSRTKVSVGFTSAGVVFSGTL